MRSVSDPRAGKARGRGRERREEKKERIQTGCREVLEEKMKGTCHDPNNRRIWKRKKFGIDIVEGRDRFTEKEGICHENS